MKSEDQRLRFRNALIKVANDLEKTNVVFFLTVSEETGADVMIWLEQAGSGEVLKAIGALEAQKLVLINNLSQLQK